MTNSHEVIELPDVNVLLALTVASHIDHAKAKAWYLEGNPFALTPVTEMGLVRLLMNPGIPDCGYSAQEALATLADLKASANCHFWPDDVSVFTTPNLATSLHGYRQVTDLHLLDLAIKNNGRLLTCDAKIASSLRNNPMRHIRTL